MKRIMAAVLLFSVMMVLLSGCLFKSDEEKIRDRMISFQDAYNAGDMEEVLACFDAKTRNTYQSAFNIGNALIGGLTGFSVEIGDMFGLGIAVMAEGDILDFVAMDINIISETKAIVTVTCVYQDRDYSDTGDATFTLVKEKGDWFIKG